MKKYLIIAVISVLSLACKNKTAEMAAKGDVFEKEKVNTSKKPLFRTSITATEIDFIKASDKDAFKSIEFVGNETKEMPGALNGEELMDHGTYVFKAHFSDDASVEIWLHSSFGSKEKAKAYANKLTSRLGKLPSFMRKTLNHVVVHTGDHTAFAEDAGGFFVLYSDNMDTRIGNNDLEETVFHETCHVTFDLKYAKSKAWKAIQAADKSFITEYAKSKPNQEDIAETALFVYTMKTYPNRLSNEIEQWVKTNIPNRYEFLEKFF
ncbi:hypothetical protein [Tamlana crocina]|uniref:Uncharacterized protein n=1 Tax=Tamlana crocina TaxID=393006 RepID=A0ABX1DEA8_9FLAO|nr:hypothetical protein [Tamlana crocina]NJX16054.1 hypothetical protein [Tamlana crocina]